MTKRTLNSEKSSAELAVGAQGVAAGARLRVEEGRITPLPNEEFEAVKNLRQAGSHEVLFHTVPEYLPPLRGEMFELVSFAIPARWQGVRSETDRVVLEQEFRNQVAIALTPFVEQLPVGAGLVAEYELSPVGGGAVTLVARFAAECCGNAGADGGFDEELRTCLSALSDHYTFRGDGSGPAFPGKKGAQTWIVRPLSVNLQAAAGIGFTAPRAETAAEVRLPAMDLSRAAPGNNSSGCWPTWPAGLLHALKAARAGRTSFRIRIRLRRERLSEAAIRSLNRLTADDCIDRAGASSTAREDGLGAPPCSTSMLDSLLAGWCSVAPDALRVELEADVSGGRPNESLLRILAGEVFPGRFVEILPAVQAANLASAPPVLDLSNLYPLAAGLPPLLPHPALLEALDYPRHHDNPSIALPVEGILLGTTPMNGFEHPVRIAEADRSRHTYVLGATGSGKSTLLYNMICQDMNAGRGVALIDPHGDLFEQVLASVPNGRVRDVVIIDPSDSETTVGLNPLDLGPVPEVNQGNRLANDLLDIFETLYDMRVAGGPGFEMFFRNTLMLASTACHDRSVAGLPKAPPTLMTVVEILRNEELRNHLLGACKRSFLGADLGGEVVSFFESTKKQRGDQSFENWVPYVSSKLTRFLNNPRLRRMLCAPRKTINFRRVLDEQKILLVHLNKGEIGDQDTKMLGMLLTKFIFQAALSRSDVPRCNRTPFHFYLDEFQAFVTPDVANALAESRKYGLHMCLAHQTMSQLDTPGSRTMMKAVLGNCANKLVFRVGIEEAQILEPAFLPRFDASTMSQLPDRKVLARILVKNRPTPPFVFETMPALSMESLGHGIDVSHAARAWSRHVHSPDSIADRDDFANTTGKGEEDTAVEPGAARPVSLMNGLLAISSGSKATDTDVAAIVDTACRAISRWQSLAHSAAAPTVRPQVGRFYWTANRSLVLACTVAEDGAAKGVVIVGGHGESGLRGACAGDAFIISSDGKFSSDAPLSELLGMHLIASADVRFDDEGAFKCDLDKTGAWLFGANRLVGTATPGFYETLNRSIVFVTDSDATEASRVGVVCLGGHGFSKIVGEKPFERYRVSSLGQFEVSAETGGNLPATTLGYIAGMSLARRLHLKGTDILIAFRSQADPTRRPHQTAEKVG